MKKIILKSSLLTVVIFLIVLFIGPAMIYADPAPAPTFSPPSGAVSLGTIVTITSSFDANVIFYTTDGTDPTSLSPYVTITNTVKTVKVIINAPMTIKAYAAGSGYGTSDIGSATYTITEAPQAAPRPLTPDEWVNLNLNMEQLLNHYGATSIGFLGMLYDNSMLRIPDEPGLNYWNEQLTGGVFGANFIVEHFIFSDEIGAKVAAMSNDEYINFLYGTLFARVPDTNGYNNWLSYINSGFSKEETLRAFLNNEEWINICSMFNVTP